MKSKCVLWLFAVFVCLCAAQERAQTERALDMTRIEQLHNRDAVAAKKGDVQTLSELWTDDAVALPPGEAPVIGVSAIRKWLMQSQGDSSKVEVLEYVIDFQEVTILGDQAIEWGRTKVAIRPRGTSTTLRASGNLMRILKKQPDGTWKISRSAWNAERPAPDRQ